GSPSEAAAALATARDAATATFPPRREKSEVPSISWRSRSASFCEVTSIPRRRGSTSSRNRSIPTSTPPSGKARASCRLVLAPLGAAARPRTPSACTSTSTVASPRLSRILRMSAASMDGIQEPLHGDRDDAPSELPHRDLHGVHDAPDVLEEDGRPHRDLQSAGADDASSLKTRVRHQRPREGDGASALI